MCGFCLQCVVYLTNGLPTKWSRIWNEKKCRMSDRATSEKMKMIKHARSQFDRLEFCWLTLWNCIISCMNLLNNLSLLVFLIRTKFLKSNFLHSYSISNHFKFITSAVILKNGSNLTCVNPADDQLCSCSYIAKTYFNYRYYITFSFWKRIGINI